MTAKPAPRPGGEAFASPASVNQRRYEAIRAYLYEGAPLDEAAARFGYSRSALASLVRDWRAGKLTLFAEPRRPGRKSAPKKDAARARVIKLRRQGLSVYEISARLAAELTGTRRVSHVDDLLDDPAAGLFAGLAVLPKKSALTSYSYRLTHDHQRSFLAALDAKLIAAGLAGSDEGIFDLDFHAVMHWGADPVLEKHYVPTRSQRARSVLTFFAQDSGTHNLVYANADLSKATQAREVIAFCDHWKAVSGHDPKMLVMDQKVTNQAVLGELDARGVKFLTLRMRSPALTQHINSLRPADFKTITLDRPGPHNKPKVHQDKAVTLTSYPRTVRQLIVTGLGRDAPTVIITNQCQATIRNLISQYARRMTIEQRLAEIIRSFCADALSSTVNLNVDLDIMLCVMAQALLAAFRTRLGAGYATATPDTLQRRFLDSSGTITTGGDTITVRIDRRAYSPVLRQASLPADTTVPWWHGRRLHFEFS